MAGSERRLVTNSRPLPLVIQLGAASQDAIRRPAAVWRLWRRRLSARRELASLSERDLGDIGLSRAAVADEIAKPFWRG